MARWCEIEGQAPELAAVARRFLDLHVHKTLATLRRDGSPRISGTETMFAEGDVWLGSMSGSMKARDLLRDPRFALHSGSVDPPDWEGDAKIAGTVEEVTDPAVFARLMAEVPPGPAHLFRCDVTEVVVVRLGDPADHLVVESWHEGRGVSQVKRT